MVDLTGIKQLEQADPKPLPITEKSLRVFNSAITENQSEYDFQVKPSTR
jgi:hypothetical protein